MLAASSITTANSAVNAELLNGLCEGDAGQSQAGSIARIILMASGISQCQSPCTSTSDPKNESDAMLPMQCHLFVYLSLEQMLDDGYRPQWKGTFSWLRYNNVEDRVFCEICSKAKGLKVISALTSAEQRTCMLHQIILL